MEQPDRPSTDDEEWAKRQAEADIAQFKNAVEDATVEEVEEPTGRKDVEIAYEQGRDFIVEEGTAVGVYRERSDGALVRVHVDWVGQEQEPRGRTTVEAADLVDLEESQYR